MKNTYILIPNLNELKVSTQNERKFLFEELKRMASQYQSMTLSPTPPVASTTYMGMAIFNLSLLYLLTEDITYANEAKRWMKTVVSYEEWGYSYLVNVDLSASWILFGLSLGYHYLQDVLDASEKSSIFKKLVKHGDIMYAYRQKTYGHGWSTQYYQNHNWINMTGLATAGYVLKEAYLSAHDWIYASKENFSHVYPNLADDGSDYEGVPYWHYGVFWLFVYADLLKKEEGYDYFKTSNFLKNTFEYKMAQTLPDLKQIINFGDAHDYRSGHSIAMYFKIAAEFNLSEAQFLGHYVFNHFYHEEQASSHLKPGLTCEIGLALLWFNGDIQSAPIDTLKQHYFFEDLGLMAFKKGNQTASTMFSIKCEKPGGRKQFYKSLEYLAQGINLFGLSHHHPDNSHYVLVKDGQYYVIDDGYNRLVGMKHHNVITAGDYGCDIEFVSDPYSKSIHHRIEQKTFDKEHYGGYVKLSKYIGNTAFYLCDTAGVFAEAAQMERDERLVISPNLDYVLIFDRVASKIAHPFKWHFHTEIEPVINEAKMTITQKHQLTVETILPVAFKRGREIQTIKSLYTPQEPNDFRLIDMIDSVIESDLTKEAAFLNVMSFEPLNIQKEDGFIEIQINGRKDIFVYNQNQVFKTNADFVYIQDFEGTAQKIFMYQGSTLSMKGVVVKTYEILQ